MNRLPPAAEASDELRPPSPPGRSRVTTGGLPGMGAHLCFILCGILTVYAAVSRGPPVVPLVPVQPPVPFFRQQDPVTDYFTGDSSAALARAASGHASLLFFYAPWDSASQVAREELVRAAHILSGQVEVLAINCWHVTGDCRKKIKNITSYPFVLISLRHGRGVQYSGPIEAAHLVRFVQRVLRPLRRLETATDLALLQAASTTIAVGYTPFVAGRPPPSYFSLLRAALLSLEDRPATELSWAVVTNGRAAARLRLHHPGGLAVVNWNGTTILKQPATGALTAELMRNYVSLRRREMAGWLELPDSKSNTLHVVLSQGAALLVFDRRRPLSPAADMETLTPARRVWLDYNNCNRSETVNLMARLQHTIATGLVPSERQRVESCLKWVEAGRQPTPDTDNCPARTLSGGQQSDGRTAQAEDGCPRPPTGGGGFSPDNFRHSDPGLMEMVRQQRTAYCRGLLVDPQHHQHQQEQQQGEDAALVNITGLCCSTNRTVNIYMLDLVRHAPLARRLGLAGGQPGAVILDSEAESQYELEVPVTAASLGQFIADHTVGRLRRRLVSRVDSGGRPDRQRPSGSPAGGGGGPTAEEGGSQRRPPGVEHSGWATEQAGGGWTARQPAECGGRRSGDGDGPSTPPDGPPTTGHDGLSTTRDEPSITAHDELPTAPSDGPSTTPDEPSTRHDRPSAPGGGGHPAPVTDSRPLSGLTEMTSETFQQVALNNTEDVVVYFYSAGCGHCSAQYHVFLAALRLFANSGLRFARIDGAANDLRWEFSLETFPTVMYLPARRKSESRVFPADVPFTLGYLLRFLLANASGAVRNAFFYSQCDAACRATTAYKTRRQAALVRRRQLSGARRTLARHTAELARLRRALRVAVTARTDSDGL